MEGVIKMDALLSSIPAEKQHDILSAGFYCFGNMGYKKTSVSDIAQKAGISKPMVFHYFGSKRNLYVYLMETASDLMEAAIEKNCDRNCDDFFEKLIADMKSKEEVIDIYPSILQFQASLVSEDDKEVIGDVEMMKERGRKFHAALSLNHINLQKFKETVNAQIVFELIAGYVESITRTLSKDDVQNTKVIFEKTYECIEMLKINFYNAEYLEER